MELLTSGWETDPEARRLSEWLDDAPALADMREKYALMPAIMTARSIWSDNRRDQIEMGICPLWTF